MIIIIKPNIIIIILFLTYPSVKLLTTIVAQRFASTGYSTFRPLHFLNVYLPSIFFLDLCFKLHDILKCTFILRISILFNRRYNELPNTFLKTILFSINISLRQFFSYQKFKLNTKLIIVFKFIHLMLWVTNSRSRLIMRWEAKRQIDQLKSHLIILFSNLKHIFINIYIYTFVYLFI